VSHRLGIGTSPLFRNERCWLTGFPLQGQPATLHVEWWLAARFWRLAFAYDHVETNEAITLSDCWTVSGPFQRIHCSGKVSGQLTVDVAGSVILGSAGKFRHVNSGNGTEGPYEGCTAETTGYVRLSKRSRCISVSLLHVPCEAPGFGRMTGCEPLSTLKNRPRADFRHHNVISE